MRYIFIYFILFFPFSDCFAKKENSIIITHVFKGYSIRETFCTLFLDISKKKTYLMLNYSIPKKIVDLFKIQPMYTNIDGNVDCELLYIEYEGKFMPQYNGRFEAIECKKILNTYPLSKNEIDYLTTHFAKKFHPKTMEAKPRAK